MKRTNWAGWMAATVLSVGALALQAKEYTEELHKVFELKDGGKIELENVNGNVTITAWDKAEVQLDAIKRADKEQDLAPVEILIESRPDRLVVRTKYPKKQGLFGKSNSTRVEYSLRVPAKATLDEVGTVNGQMRIEGMAGEVRASSVNGNVEVAKSTGAARLNTVNGSIKLGYSAAEPSPKSVELETVNGKIELLLPDGFNADVRAETVSGSIASDFDELKPKKELVGSNLKGVLGKGGTKVKLNTVNGKIAILRKSEPAAAP